MVRIRKTKRRGRGRGAAARRKRVLAKMLRDQTSISFTGAKALLSSLPPQTDDEVATLIERLNHRQQFEEAAELKEEGRSRALLVQPPFGDLLAAGHKTVEMQRKPPPVDWAGRRVMLFQSSTVTKFEYLDEFRGFGAGREGAAVGSVVFSGEAEDATSAADAASLARRACLTEAGFQRAVAQGYKFAWVVVPGSALRLASPPSNTAMGYRRGAVTSSRLTTSHSAASALRVSNALSGAI